MNKFLLTAAFGVALLVAGCFGGNGTSNASQTTGGSFMYTGSRTVDCDTGIIIYTNGPSVAVVEPQNNRGFGFIKNVCGG